MVSTTLKRQFQFYLDHQAELVRKYDGKVIVLKDDVVLGAYSDEAEAVRETQREHELGTFLVQRVSAGSEDYTQTFQSRVVIP